MGAIARRRRRRRKSKQFELGIYGLFEVVRLA